MGKKSIGGRLVVVAMVGILVGFVSDEDPKPVFQSIEKEFKSYEPKGQFDRRKIREELKAKYRAARNRRLLEDPGLHEPRSFPDFSLPDRVDLRNQLSTEHPNQGQVGSCETFSNMASIEAAYFREHGRVVKFSEQWALRLLVGSQLYETYPMGFSPGVYMGLRANELLWWARAAGFCSAAALPYDATTLEKYDFEFRKTEHNPKRVARDLVRFKHRLFLYEDTRLGECQREDEVSKGAFAGFSEVPIDVADSKTLVQILAFGIPVQYVVHSRGPSDEIEAPKAHAVLIVGYDQGLERFEIRNSWGAVGQYERPTMIRFKRVDRESHASDAYDYIPTVVVGPGDRKRICAHPEGLPKDLTEGC